MLPSLTTIDSALRLADQVHQNIFGTAGATQGQHHTVQLERCWAEPAATPGCQGAEQRLLVNDVYSSRIRMSWLGNQEMNG